ncbi:MAG: amino acid permease [Ignavibacteriae bacterium]|nr:amino acid permease [Ignavibacteriota bacterium]
MELSTSRPRVLGWLRSAAFLDGDWGTSIAYVLGIGFALGGYASFWHLMMMLSLTALVAVNYMTICRLYPNGGGVYSSVYHRSRTFAVIGALLLGADYVITMSLSILEACHYFGLENAPIWAIALILCIGSFNWFGPKQTGGVALFISISTILSLATIVASSAPTALTSAYIEPLSGGFLKNWGIFAAIILSISGIESISNMTGLMKDPTRDSRRAISAVLTKISIATVFLTLAMHAVPGLEGRTEDMLRFLGEHYVGEWFGWVIGLALGLLLLSAGNTAMNDLVNIQFLMAVDKELPQPLRLLNRYGMPIIPLVIATAAPVIILLIVHDVLILAHLYAIGVVGAILINIGSTATDNSLGLKKKIRFMMMVSAVVLFFVEISIAIEKPDAALFAGVVLFVGLSARRLAQRKKAVPVPSVEVVTAPAYRNVRTGRKAPTAKFLVAMKTVSDRLLQFAIEEAKARNALLYVLRIKEIAVGSLPEKLEFYGNGAERKLAETLDTADINYHVISISSYEVGYTIAEQAATLGVDRLILGATQRTLVEKALRGDVLKTVSALLPEEIQLIIYRA